MAFGAHDTGLRRLAFPPGYPPTTKTRYEPSTAIQQYSTGRSHILGLSDDHKVWLWTRDQGVQIEFLALPLKSEDVLRVVAGCVTDPFGCLFILANKVTGWDRSSLYVKNTGIVFWNPSLHGAKADADTVLIHASVVPATAHHRNKQRNRLGTSPASEIGEVTHHIVLEGYIVFTTDNDKLFAFSTAATNEESSQSSPVELTTFFSSQSTSPVHIQDLQGSFRSFGVFKSSGEVLTGSTSLIDTFMAVSKSQQPTGTLPQPARIASLQYQSVITLAFGDYHIHALHANGTVSSFGVDPERVGAFGLGHAIAAGLRGAQGSRTTRDQILDGEHRRTVWFEPLMLHWLSYCFATLQPRLMIDLCPDWVFKSGEWFEQQGSRWEEGIHDDKEELPAYFALKVSAAGWHSAALVLVDEERAEKARRIHIKQPLEVGKASDTTRNGSVSVEQGHQGSWVLWEQLATSIAWIWTWSRWLVRWFLGLTARDAATAAADRSPHSSTSHGGGKDSVRYVWEDQELPHLSWLPNTEHR